MRTLMLLDNATLDGYLARRVDANAAALMPIDAEQFDWQADLLADYDTLLTGRVSYMTGAEFWPTQPNRPTRRKAHRHDQGGVLADTRQPRLGEFTFGYREPGCRAGPVADRTRSWLRQLEYFVAVAEEANFTRAAARVHVAQSGVSAQVRHLERELGQSLFDRSRRVVRLTEAGAAVLPYARAALAAVSGARLAVDEFTGLLRGHLALGTVTSISSQDINLPALLAGFHTDHPGVQISLTADNTDNLITWLRGGQLDLAFIGLGASTPEGVDAHVITSEPLVAVVSPTDALAATTTTALADLADRQLISLPRGTGLRSCLDDACAAAGIQPHVAFEAGDPRLLAELAAQGLGVAIVPQSLARTRHPQLHAITITAPAMQGRVALAWRVGGPIAPTAQAFITRVRTHHARPHLPTSV